MTKAMILAAGKGTRLREITKGEIPKPMVRVNNKPVLEYTLDRLVDFGVEEIIINLHYKGSKIEHYFGSDWKGTPIEYSWEEELKGTAGAVKNVEDRLNETFLVVYGDVITDINLEKFQQAHNKNSGLATLLLYNETDNLEESSILFLDEEQRIQKFVEKPSKEFIEKHSQDEFLTNGAVFFLEPGVFRYIEEGFTDFSKDVFPEVISSESDIYGYRLPSEDYWHEVGNPERYRKLIRDVEDGLINWP